jgi:hypothetical protein
MKNNILLITVIILVFVAGSVFFIKRSVEGLEERIIGKVRREIRDLVKEEVKRLETGEVAALKDEEAKPLITKKDTPGSQLFGEEWQALGSKIKVMVEEELKRYSAGELLSESPLGKGLRKKMPQENENPVQDSEGEVIPADLRAAASKEKAIERVLVQKGGMLLPRGRLQIEPSYTTAHFSSNKVNLEGFTILDVLFIGEMSTSKIQRDIYIETLGIKYGIWNNLQGDLRIPYRSEFDRDSTNTGTETTRRAGGLGDIDFSLSRQILYEKGIIPDAIFSLGAKSDTGKSPYSHTVGIGTGHWGFRTALVAVKSSDPAVVFGNINYSWNLPRKIADYGKVAPGSSIGYSVGTGIALSYQTAINFALEQSITSKMKIDKRPIAGSFLNAADFKAGLSWSISDRSSVDVSVAMGLTADAPDYVIEVRCPYTF